jgi:Domain of unknown function (DUF5615)
VKLLLDEQISGKVADRLRGLGHDAIAVAAETSLRGLPDRDLFEIAEAQGRAIVTYDRADFEALMREYDGAGRSHHGVIFVHPMRFHGADLSRLIAALAALLERRDPAGSFVIWLQDAD